MMPIPQEIQLKVQAEFNKEILETETGKIINELPEETATWATLVITLRILAEKVFDHFEEKLEDMDRKLAAIEDRIYRNKRTK
jgi:hypothetical protein